MQFDYNTISFLICISCAKAFFNGSEIHTCQPYTVAASRNNVPLMSSHTGLHGWQDSGQTPARWMACPAGTVPRLLLPASQM